MELTGKCKEEFEVWFEEKYDNNNTSNVIMLQTEFDSMPFEFKYSVYVDFFDSVEDVTENRILSKVSRGFKCYYTELRGNMIVFKTRPEARTAAIEKANELHNEFLNK